MPQFFGNDLFLGHDKKGNPIYLSARDRGRHMYIVGATGTGKTKAMQHCVFEDIDAWPDSHCGMLVLDLEGTLYDAATEYLAENNFHRWPIVPIDLASGDRITTYNPLRRRTAGNASVFIAHAVQSILHAWGQADVRETPRLLLWLSLILHTLYENGLTLGDAVLLLANPRLRKKLTEQATDRWMKYNLAYLGELKPEKLREELSSTIHRLNTFVTNPVIKRSLCQDTKSLDLLSAMENGAIVIASLSTKGGLISEEDAKTYGSLLLSDVWTAATLRGKGEDGEVKPFYVYCDEFQEYIGPSLASQLSRARGRGLHLALAHQFPTQLADYGATGRMVMNAALANARSKFVFELEHPADVRMLAEILFRQSIDPDEIKHQSYATRVVDHELRYLPHIGITRNTGGSNGWQKAENKGRSHTDSNQWLHTEAEGTIEIPSPDDDGESSTHLTSSFADAQGGSASDSVHASKMNGTNGSENWTNGLSVGLHPSIIPILGEEALPPQFRQIEEQLFRFTQRLSFQPNRHCWAKLVGVREAVQLVVPIIDEPLTTPKWTERWLRGACAKSGVVVSAKDADLRVKAREQQLLSSLFQSSGGDDISNVRRQLR
jgi:hypothetical protein